MALELAQLTAAHQLAGFDCGSTALNNYLQKHALQSQRSHGTVTYVASVTRLVVGYYTLLYGSIDLVHAPIRMRKGLGSYSSVPVIILARLAIDRNSQGQGLGKGLLKDALCRATAAAEIAGLRAFVVHAKDQSAKAFYERYDFEGLPGNPLHLYRLISDIRREMAG